MPGIDEFGLMDCQISCNSNRFGLGMVHTINAIGLVSDTIGTERLIIQLLAFRFLRNMTIDKGPELADVSDIGLGAYPGFVRRFAI